MEKVTEVFELLEKMNNLVNDSTLLDSVKAINMSKKEWEKQKQEYFKEIEEVDKYFEEKEKEAKKPILTDEEKEYISFVIKPFREKVESIVKGSYRYSEYIKINLVDDYTSLPCFAKGTMYNGLEPDKEYTLEELGVK